MELSDRIANTIPRQAYLDVGKAIGILHDGNLVLDTEDEWDVVGDCCLYEWFEDGRNLIQRYAERSPATPRGADESYLLNAYLQAKYRVLRMELAVPGAGVHCRDAVNGEDLFVADLAFSHSPKIAEGDCVIATRTIPLGEYWMTGGASLPIASKQCLADVMAARGGSVALEIVRICLAAGAANRIRYQGAGPSLASSRREPKHRWRRR